jgi:hypothetical protein
MKYNSARNQEIKRQFVEREVIYNVSCLVSELYKNDEYMDELLELFAVPDYEAAVEDADNIHVQFSNHLDGWVWVNKEAHEISNVFDTEQEALENAVYEHNLDYDHREALEHWIVSGFLARKLKEHGEMVADDFLGLTIWGRGTTGQAILLDNVISEICEEMEILEGQQYEWK